MKLTRKNLFLAASAIITLVVSSPAVQAATFFWDNDGTTAGFGAATGTWNSAGTVGSGTQGWGTDINGSTAPTGTITTASTNATTDSINFGTATAGLGAGTITVSGTVQAGNITFGAASGDIVLSGGTANLTAASTITVNNATNTISSIISGAGTSFTKEGSGILILSNTANTFTGATNVANGTLRARLNNGNYVGALAIASGATYAYSSTGTQTLTGVVGTGGGTVTNSSGLILRNAANAYGTLNITGGRVFIQTSTGALPSGATVNVSGVGRLVTEAGSTTYNNAISISGSGSAGLTARTATIFSNVTLPGSGTVRLNTDDVTVTTNSLTITNNQTLTGTLGITLGTANVGFTVGNVTLSGNISGVSGGLSIDSGASTSILILSGTGNSYGGNTTISAGTLRLGAAGVIPNTSNVSVTGTLDLNGFDETINGLSGAGTVDNTANSTAAILTVGGGGTFSGSITDSGTSATLALVKSGSAPDLILSGNNSYSGGTTLNSTGSFNRLFIASATALPTTGAVQVNSGATLNFNTAASPTFNQSITLASGAILAMRQAATLGNVTLPTSGSVIFNNDDAATVAFSLGNNVALTGNLTVQVGGNNLTVGAVTLGGNIDGGFGLTKTSTGTLTLSGTNSYSGETVINAGTLKANTSTTIGSSSKITVGDAGSSGTVLDATAAGLTVGAAQTLAGIGTVNATGQTVTITGTLAPGNSPGTLSMTVGTLDLGNATALAFELNPSVTTVGSNINDLVAVTGNLNLDGLLSVVATSGDFLSVAASTSWRLFDYSGTLTDDTLSLGTMPSLGSGLSWSIDTATPFQVNLVVIPEPNVAALIGAFGGILLLRRRR